MAGPAFTNFRDLGGYRAPEGHVRWGRVFRSDGLHHLTEGDLEMYRALGIRSVFDLRSETERTEQPNPFESVWLSLPGPPRGSGGGGVALAVATDGERILRDLYLDLLEHAAERIARIIGALADDERLPAVFHCHAGKDRTGVVAAVLLLALGVDREVVLDDYELTARYRLRSQQDATFERLVSLGLSREAAASVLASPRWAMAAALDVLEEHGGAGAWLTGRAGLAEADLQRLRRNLLQVD